MFLDMYMYTCINMYTYACIYIIYIYIRSTTPPPHHRGEGGQYPTTPHGVLGMTHDHGREGTGGWNAGPYMHKSVLKPPMRAPVLQPVPGVRAVRFQKSRLKVIEFLLHLGLWWSMPIPEGT